MEIRPIDANALKASFEEDGHLSAYIEEYIDDTPTLDYEPVRHSEWKYYHKQNKAVCMACSFERDLDADFGRAICCPNCGAKMGKGEA